MQFVVPDFLGAVLALVGAGLPADVAVAGASSARQTLNPADKNTMAAPGDQGSDVQVVSPLIKCEAKRRLSSLTVKPGIAVKSALETCVP